MSLKRIGMLLLQEQIHQNEVKICLGSFLCCALWTYKSVSQSKGLRATQSKTDGPCVVGFPALLLASRTCETQDTLGGKSKKEWWVCPTCSGNTWVLPALPGSCHPPYPSFLSGSTLRWTFYHDWCSFLVSTQISGWPQKCHVLLRECLKYISYILPGN